MNHFTLKQFKINSHNRPNRCEVFDSSALNYRDDLAMLLSALIFDENKMAKNFIFLAIACIFMLLPLMSGTAYAHGIGGETLPVMLGDKNATLFVGLQPSIYDPSNRVADLTVRLTDTRTSDAIHDVVVEIDLMDGKREIIKDTFSDDLGNIIIRITSTDDGDITIRGDKDDGYWKKQESSPITVSGPVFTSGGLYKFKIKILSWDGMSEYIVTKPTAEGAISLAEKTRYDVKDTNENSHKIAITSYYDDIVSFSFQPDSRTIAFVMPFEWTETNILQTTVVHEEIHISKDFGEMLVTKYDATVNGIPVPEDDVTIDDYSEDSRIVHLVLNQKELLSLLGKTEDNAKMSFIVTPSSTEQLPLKAFTHNANFEVGLSWEPVQIQTEKNTRFYVDISRYYAPKDRETVSYDFVITQNGKEVLRESTTGITNAPAKTNHVDFKFTSQDAGPVIIAIENIDGSLLSSTDFVVVVKPKEDQDAKFPIVAQSMTEQKSKGKYNVGITWIPKTLDVGNAKFIVNIYDKDTGNQIPKSKYDLVILKQGDEIYRKSAIAEIGGGFETVNFSDNNTGHLVLRIENIDQSSESVEIPIMVAPEFPMGSLLGLASVFSAVLGLVYLKKSTMF